VETALAGIHRRVGFGRDGRSFLLTDAVPAPDDIRALHQAKQYTHLAMRAGGAEPRESVRLELRDGDHRAAQQLLDELPGDGPVVAVAPGAAYGPAKEWPADHVVALAELLAREHGARILLIGAPGERAKCDELAQRIGSLSTGLLVTAGRTSVSEMAALVQQCDGFVGNDSGASHVAAATGTPTVTVFGSTPPDGYHPLGERLSILYAGIECSPCRARTCRFGHYQCLHDITPPMVLERLRALEVFGGE
jgi:heptosyltransferase-2